jgi:nucleoside-diphosphate-sugar epimerase
MGDNELTSASRIFVAGHRGMVGSAIVRQLKLNGFDNVLTRTHAELDLMSQAAVRHFFGTEKIDCVILAAAKVGGILANNEYPAEFIYQNLMIEANVIHEAYSAGIQRLLFLGSSCIYPKFAEQPMSEAALLTGQLESTNEPYAIAKIAGIKMCESYNRQYGTDYRSIMPTNLYGPGDNFHPQNSHVIPALMRRLHEAKLAEKPVVVIWGTGNPKREFLHVDDLASASVYLLLLEKADYNREYSPMLSHVNVGTGEDVAIRDLAELIAGVVDYKGKLEFDHSKPDGTPRKLLDVSRLNTLGWSAKIPLQQGLREVYSWFVSSERLRL